MSKVSFHIPRLPPLGFPSPAMVPLEVLPFCSVYRMGGHNAGDIIIVDWSC